MTAIFDRRHTIMWPISSQQEWEQHSTTGLLRREVVSHSAGAMEIATAKNLVSEAAKQEKDKGFSTGSNDSTGSRVASSQEKQSFCKNKAWKQKCLYSSSRDGLQCCQSKRLNIKHSSLTTCSKLVSKQWVMQIMDSWKLIFNKLFLKALPELC